MANAVAEGKKKKLQEPNHFSHYNDKQGAKYSLIIYII